MSSVLANHSKSILATSDSFPLMSHMTLYSGLKTLCSDVGIPYIIGQYILPYIFIQLCAVSSDAVQWPQNFVQLCWYRPTLFVSISYPMHPTMCSDVICCAVASKLCSDSAGLPYSSVYPTRFIQLCAVTSDVFT